MDKKTVLVVLSFVISLIGIGFSIKAQVELYEGWFVAEGKNRALYGLSHIIYFSYGWFFFCSLVLAIMSFSLKGKYIYSWSGVLLAVLGVTLLYGSWYTHWLPK